MSDKGLSPDPIIVHVNDVVIWSFAKPQSNGLVFIQSEHELAKYQELSQDIVPRRYLSRAFSEPGTYHFASLAFDAALHATRRDGDYALDVRTKNLDKSQSNWFLSNDFFAIFKTIILSSVIVDKLEEYSTVLVDSEGFHPEVINVEVVSCTGHLGHFC